MVFPEDLDGPWLEIGGGRFMKLGMIISSRFGTVWILLHVGKDKFVWMCNDGEISVAGSSTEQELAKGYTFL